jgi:hypothetical protein
MLKNDGISTKIKKMKPTCSFALIVAAGAIFAGSMTNKLNQGISQWRQGTT